MAPQGRDSVNRRPHDMIKNTIKVKQSDKMIAKLEMILTTTPQERTIYKVQHTKNVP